MEVGELDRNHRGGNRPLIVEELALGMFPGVEEAGSDCDVERASKGGEGGVAPRPGADGLVIHEGVEFVTPVAFDRTVVGDPQTVFRYQVRDGTAGSHPNYQFLDELKRRRILDESGPIYLLGQVDGRYPGRTVRGLDLSPPTVKILGATARRLEASIGCQEFTHRLSVPRLGECFEFLAVSHHHHCGVARGTSHDHRDPTLDRKPDV